MKQPTQLFIEEQYNGPADESVTFQTDTSGVACCGGDVVLLITNVGQFYYKILDVSGDMYKVTLNMKRLGKR